MRSASFAVRAVLILACAGALALGHGSRVAAQEDGGFYAAGAEAVGDEATLEIHKAECHHGVGPDIYEECHANAVEGVAFEVNGAVGVTDAEGFVSFHGPPTTVTITEDPETFALYLGAYVYCRDFVDDEVLYDDSATDSGGVVTLDIAAGDRVVCDWYDIFEAADGDGDADEVGGVTALPNTGVGAAGVPWGRSDVAPVLIVASGLLAASVIGRRRRPI